MFEQLIRLSLRYRNLTLGLGVALLLGGLQAWLTLPIDAFPDISPTQAKLILKIPGMTPEEIEQIELLEAHDKALREKGKRLRK